MTSQEQFPLESVGAPPARSQGDIYEGIAFTFCKAATIILLTGKFALPVASGAAAVFYALALLNGKTDTRCVLRAPALIAALWGTVCVVSTCLILRRLLGH